jgi:hypothetical protein
MWPTSISLWGKPFDLVFTPPFSGNGPRESFSGVAELSRQDAKNGKKDPQITQITQISACDCLSLGPEEPRVWQRLVYPFGVSLLLTVICVICGSYPFPF